MGSDIFASGAADGTVKVWKIIWEETKVQCQLLQSILLKPRYFPLAVALKQLSNTGKTSTSKGIVLAVGGTRSTIQIFVAQDESEPNFELSATLMGHQSWIRSLAFTPDGFAIGGDTPQSQDFFLASASQDKYIRLWKIHPGDITPAAQNSLEEKILGGTVEPTLTNKAHRFEANGIKYSVTFEALLFGHEDWVYTVAWNPDPLKPQLLSASADNSLVIWEPDPVTGVWFSSSRMGEISALKGSTTATGSAGGFWIGLWSPSGDVVTSLSRTGSWRSWKYDASADAWAQIIGITGHVKSAADLAWEGNGGYLLSTSTDQTTRLHAEWKQDGHHAWHEISRPQIHGYDLNCISSLGPSRFISGADEKLLRVFNETKAVAQLISRLSGFTPASEEDMPEAASMPVLGLSNKAMDEEIDGEGGANGAGEEVSNQAEPQVYNLEFEHPPLEDHLSKHTLWPEHEKLYGHGYEISAVASSYDGSIVATACKASSIDHAVIRLYDTSTWNEIRPPLTAHSLTITSLRFSYDDNYLLSVGRDRQWAVFERNPTDKFLYQLLTSNPKGHSRMILSASWAPHPTMSVFATAGRDKSVKVWAREGDTYVCKSSIPVSRPVTAIDVLPILTHNSLYVAIGDDSGQISIHKIEPEGLAAGANVLIPKLESPSKSITQVSWRPLKSPVEIDGGVATGDKKIGRHQLAVASEDSSVRIYNIDDLPA